VCRPDTTGVRCEDGPVAFYPLDEGSGGIVNPAQGLVGTGAINGPTWTSQGTFGTAALRFDGTDDYVDVPNHDSLNATNALTLEAWVKPEAGAATGPAWRAITGVHNGGAGGYYLAVNFTQGPGLSVWLGSACGWRYSNVTPPLNEWRHVAATWDGATARLYLDGTEVGASACAGTLTASSSPLHIGGLGAWRPTDAPWLGLIDEVAIYRTALPAATIRAHAREGDHCDGLDNDCDGFVDEARYPDPYKNVWANKGGACDGADYDLCLHGTYTCAGQGLTIECVNEDPEEIEESCNGEDDDCRGDLPLDEHDDDNDGYMICEGDCDDLSAAFSPSAPELCNGFDNDCDGVLPVQERDLDGDGYLACIPGQLYNVGTRLQWADCDDGNPNVHKGAVEWCNGIDDDCDGLTDADDPNVRNVIVHRYSPIGAPAGSTVNVVFDGLHFADAAGRVDFGYGVTVESVVVEGNNQRLTATIRIGTLADGLDRTRLYAPRDIRFGTRDCGTTIPEGFDVFDPTEVPTLTEWGVLALAALMLALGVLAVFRRRAGAAALLVAAALLWPRLAGAECGGIAAAEPITATCAQVTTAGCCLGDVVVWCADGDALVCGLDCGRNAVAPWDQCGWREPLAGYDCGGSGADPSGTLPLTCGFTCTPQCTGRSCGPDGCGGTCGAGCGAHQVCNDSGHCVAPATCNPAGATLSCGDVVSGDTTGGALLIDQHRGCSSWDESGPERAWAFTPAVSDTVALRLTTQDGVDLDVFLLEAQCNELACVAADDTELVTEVTGGTHYYVVVDGFRGASGPFELEVVCQSTFVPQCAGRSCGPDGGPFDGTCGACGGGTPYCHEESGQCEPDRCAGVPAEGCCEGTLAKRCVENRILTEDCTRGLPGTCGFWAGGAGAAAGWYCGFAPSTSGTGDCTCTAPDAGCDPGWACGFDACGDPCGPGCPHGQECQGHTCVLAPTCITTAQPLTCTDGAVVIEGTTRGGPSVLNAYPGCVWWDESGPERAYSFFTAESGPYRAALGNLSADLDLFVLDDDCFADSCIAYGDSEVAWNAVAGHTYFVIVDGFAGLSSDFRLTLGCACLPDCGSRVCGDDGCGGSCGSCDAGEACQEGACCTQQCAGRVCGDDGCGGQCGSCNTAAGEICVDGACADYGDWCATLGVVGCCDGTLAYWCAGGLPESIDCEGPCGWDPLFEFYTCGGDGEDPTHAWPLECPWAASGCTTGADCDDQNPATADACRDGRCVHAPCDCAVDGDCDDDDPGTLDTCRDCRCSRSAILACEPPDCDDGDACTLDRCAAGICEHDRLADCCTADAECADANPCTADACVANVCRNSAVEGCCRADAECGDGDPCTDDACVGSVCTHWERLGCCRAVTECDDGDPCSADACTGNACTHTDIPACCVRDDECDDEAACTEDACVDNRCVHTPLVDCCTRDADCGQPGPCEAVTCSAGMCFTLPIQDCCTDDAECDDRQACTADTCAADGTCGHAPIEGCCDRDADCRDDDACTDDICDGATCRHIDRVGCCRDAGECDDGDACTDDDCVGQRCAHTLAAGCCRVLADCDDDDACTVDTCTDGRCVHTTRDCADGDPCTVDTCVDGGCRHAALDCDDGDDCTVDSCGAGGCRHVLRDCDDGNPCTTDACAAGACTHDPIAGCTCDPTCAGKACGEGDGCGGRCAGACPAGERCVDFTCVPQGADVGQPDDDTGGAPGDDTTSPGADTPGPGSDGGLPGSDGGLPGEDGAGGPDAGGGGGGGGGGGCAAAPTAGGGAAPGLALALALLGLVGVLAGARRRRT
jgi:hypothetical protein